jgi:Glycosyl hydrolases family 8
MQNDINSECNLRRSLLASFVGVAGLGLAACGGGGADEASSALGNASTNPNSSADLGTGAQRLAATNFPACNATGGVNASQFATRFDQYFVHVMGASGKSGTVYKDLDYPGTTKFAACIDPARYGGNDGTGNTYVNTAKSEGQGYGMVLCAAYGDRTKFDRLWNFTYTHMRVTSGSQKDFFDYLNTPYDGAKHVGTGIAPDGEIWIVTGLLMAWKRWNATKYRDAADVILAALKREWASLFKGGVVRSWYTADHTNPSYVNPAFFKYWDTLRPNTGWDKIITANRNLLVDATDENDGLAFDWTNFDGTQRYSDGLPTGHGADAVRVAMNCALDTVWNGTTVHKENSQNALNKLNGRQDIADFAAAMYATYALTGVGGCNTKVTPYTYRLLNNDFVNGYYEGLLCAIACGILGGRIKKF